MSRSFSGEATAGGDAGRYRINEHAPIGGLVGVPLAGSSYSGWDSPYLPAGGCLRTTGLRAFDGG